MRHVIYSENFNKQFLQRIFDRTDQIQTQFKTPAGSYSSSGRKYLREKFQDSLLFNIFYEPSTRTRISFSAAAHHWGMSVVETENAAEFSSAVKGESLEDSIRVLCEYHPSVIVLRHSQDGAAERAARVSSVPIINAGDGKWQHPTQALLDVYTIRQKLGRLDNLTIVIGGDLAYSRTARSLIHLMLQFPGNQFILVSPPELSVLADLKQTFASTKTPHTEVQDNSDASIKEALAAADVVYWTRLQKERIPVQTLDSLQNSFTITHDHLDIMKRDAILMHPLPRNEEISKLVDSDPRAVYFQQPGNGMFVRMALLEWVING